MYQIWVSELGGSHYTRDALYTRSYGMFRTEDLSPPRSGFWVHDPPTQCFQQTCYSAALALISGLVHALCGSFFSRELGPHWKNFYTSINSLEMFPDPTKNSVADDLARHMATEEIVGVGKSI